MKLNYCEYYIDHIILDRYILLCDEIIRRNLSCQSKQILVPENVDMSLT